VSFLIYFVSLTEIVEIASLAINGSEVVLFFFGFCWLHNIVAVKFNIKLMLDHTEYQHQIFSASQR
jgi:hypothetical protein